MAGLGKGGTQKKCSHILGVANLLQQQQLRRSGRLTPTKETSGFQLRDEDELETPEPDFRASKIRRTLDLSRETHGLGEDDSLSFTPLQNNEEQHASGEEPMNDGGQSRNESVHQEQTRGSSKSSSAPRGPTRQLSNVTNSDGGKKIVVEICQKSKLLVGASSQKLITKGGVLCANGHFLIAQLGDNIVRS
ncbi:OLC1v1018721C1 [Oldenlandia corymbosa var. corymbosa]|uniref:OLC1v1018721C1 n=1 Tax=Oldenlandia corymbosa var. corymbosa TaxID=529605 RepID=A0AAV1ECD4_OLDCO|nr:OLC1v1018721C1 [Oldenlandia corymbosa var. corymbosa]